MCFFVFVFSSHDVQKTIMGDTTLENIEEACKHQHLREAKALRDKAYKCFADVLKNHGEKTIVIMGIKFKFTCPAAYGNIYIISACNVFRLREEGQKDNSYKKLFSALDEINSKSLGAKAVCEYRDIHIVSQGRLPDNLSYKTDYKIFKNCFKAIVKIMDQLGKVLSEYTD